MALKGQMNLTTIVVGAVMTIILSAILIYAVGFPILIGLNDSGVVPTSQQGNFDTVLVLLGITVLIVALAAFIVITRVL